MSKLFDESIDETKAEWEKVDCSDFIRYVGRYIPKSIDICLPQIEKYGHFIIGRNDLRWFIGIPGRFLQSEKPPIKAFSLWQPLAGGETLYDSLENISEEMQEKIYGYWICGICPRGKRLQRI